MSASRLLRTFGLITSIALSPCHLFAQSSPAPPATADPFFEVAAIKPGNPDMRPGFPSNGRNFIAHNETVEGMLRFAYTIRSEQIINRPDWFSKDHFDISATTNLTTEPTGDQWKAMLRKLLADRFGLTLHHEQRVLPVYVLSVGKSGAKLKASDPKDIGRNDASISITNISTTLSTRGETMSSLAIVLQGFLLDRPVVNQTGLAGSYDLNINFTPIVSNVGGLRVPDQDPNSSAASIFTAIQDLGLRLDATKQPVDVLVIEHASHPPLD